MKIVIEKLKPIIKNAAEVPHVAVVEQEAEPVEPGQWPTRGPTPSKVAVVLYYLSCIFCVIGAIMIIHAFFKIRDEDKVQVLTTGSIIITVGLVAAIAMNAMNKREHDRILQYVMSKVEEMKDNPNSRQTFNKEYQLFIGSEGPNGIR